LGSCLSSIYSRNITRYQLDAGIEKIMDASETHLILPPKKNPPQK
jgi:hypothetical protein